MFWIKESVNSFSSKIINLLLSNVDTWEERIIMSLSKFISDSNILREEKKLNKNWSK